MVVYDNLLNLPPPSFSFDENGRLIIPDNFHEIISDATLRRNRATRRMKSRKPNSEVEVDRRVPVVQGTDDDSSSLSSSPSSAPLPPSSSGKVLSSKSLAKNSRRVSKGLTELLEEIVQNILTCFKLSQEDAFQAKPMVSIPVPDHIKAILVDDWENVTKNQQLVPLPVHASVNQIFNDYGEYESARRQEGTAQSDVLQEFIIGMKEYFEMCLGRILLYR